jgi:hypothetical protein
LLLIVASEIDAALPWLDESSSNIVRTPVIEAQVVGDDASAMPRLADTSAILARPLFNWNRRPGQSSELASADSPLPRLAGILVSGRGRYAIFAAPPGAKPQVVPEGGTIGRFTIDKITADHIILNNDGALQTVHTTFGAKPPSPMPTPDAS